MLSEKPSTPGGQPPADPAALGAFPLTQWSLVGEAGRADDATRRQLLGVLLQRYWPALRAHLVLKKRLRDDAADDLLQGFVADKVVEQNLLAQADRRRGKFRTFLCTALDHYLVSQVRRQTAQKRAPADGLANLDDAAEPAVAGGSEPGRAYDLAWARAVLAEAVKRMEAECVRSDRPVLWALFEERILKPTLGGEEPAGYDVLVKRLKLESPLQASNLLVTVKRQFARTLRAVVGEYAGEDEVEEELRDLRDALAGG